MILTPQEVRDNSFLKDSRLICELIFLEQDIICRCFGMDFYRKLVADKKVTEADEWQDRIYKKGVVVYWHGYYFESIVDRNRSEPYNEECWVKVDKFNSECFNQIWDKLRVWLANEIAIHSIPFLGHRIGDNGIQSNVDTQTSTRRADAGDEYIVTKSYEEINARRLDVLGKYMEESTCAFPEVKCCDTDLYMVWR